MIDTAGRQTPDMTGLTRAQNVGNPKIYRMTEGMWVFTYTYGNGSVIKVFGTWNRCIKELDDTRKFFNKNYIVGYL